MEDKDLMNLLLLLVVGFLIWKAVKGKVALGSTYSNEERWEIVRDSEGNLKEIVVHRDAREY